jgi:hypothetical protein
MKAKHVKFNCKIVKFSTQNQDFKIYFIYYLSHQEL